MAEESVKIEVLGFSTEIGGDDENQSSVVESRPQKEFELVAVEDAEPARVALKDVALESSEESAIEDGVGVTDEGAAGGAEERSEGATATSEGSAAEEEEQEEECGFCLFMKAGPCGERFSIWQNCVDEAEKSGEDIVEKCAQTTSLLKVCMEMNLQYYGPVLDAEKAMEDVASQDENQAADIGKPADQDKDREATSAGEDADSEETGKLVEVVGVATEENADSENTGKVVEVIGVTSVDGQVTEIVDVVVEAAN